MGSFGMTELLVILAIVLLIFGPKRLKTLGSDLGNAIKGFRSAVTDDQAAKPDEQERVIDGETDSSTAQHSDVKQDSKI